MRLLALHGMAGAGKDTFADRLVAAHGFVKRGFADPLYEEVAGAYRVTVVWLRERSRKELPQPELALVCCLGFSFRSMLEERGEDRYAPRSPRWVLEQWGTDYRRQYREANDAYWLDRMAEFAAERLHDGSRGLVIPDCRFANEARWVRANGGHVAHIMRPELVNVSSHVSALPLPPDLIDSTVCNTAGISHVHSVADSAPYSCGDTVRAA